MFFTGSRFVCLHYHLPSLAYFTNNNTETIIRITQEKLDCETHYSGLVMKLADGQRAASIYYFSLGLINLHFAIWFSSLRRAEQWPQGHWCEYGTRRHPGPSGSDTGATGSAERSPAPRWLVPPACPALPKSSSSCWWLLRAQAIPPHQKLRLGKGSRALDDSGWVYSLPTSPLCPSLPSKLFEIIISVILGNNP